jgi:hypothetical protein
MNFEPWVSSPVLIIFSMFLWVTYGFLGSLILPLKLLSIGDESIELRIENL